MRKLKSNAADDFRVKAYAGTNGVLLAFDVDESRKAGLLGFAIQQKEEGKDSQWLLNSLTFPGFEHTIPKWKATPSNIAPIQKFRWSDYTVRSGVTCRYRVHPAYGSPGDIELGDALEVSVTADDGKPEDQRVKFNRAVAASQSFGRQFPELDELLTADTDLPIEDWPPRPRKWLENGLLDQILNFIGKAKNDTWALDLAIYEYELKAIVEAINAAHDRGVDVRVIYHAKAGDEQTALNKKSLEHIPAGRKRGRVTKKIFHDKFIVLSKINSAGDRVPKEVLCGSTNFTENGVYRQANVVHIATRTDMAKGYLDLFEIIWANASDVSACRKWIDVNNAFNSDASIFVGFSPRKGKVDLTEFVNIIDSADKDLLFATAFELPKTILDALLGAPNDRTLRYGIQNTKSRITGFHADRTAEFTAPALLSKGLEGWVKEGLKGQKGRLLIHTKAIVVNFTTENPIILSGSHNLSVSASGGNDENYLILRGDTDLADRYGIEIMRFYDHYRFRYYAKLLELEEAKPLSPNESWADKYFEAGNLRELSRLRFAGRLA